MKAALKEKDNKNQFIFVLPLENFETKIQELSISPHVKVRPLSKEERKSLACRFGPLEVTNPMLPRHCLEVEAKNFQPSVKKAYPIVSALRLLKSNLNRCKSSSSF